MWNVEIIPTFEMAGPTRISALANISGATTLFGRNATWFAEYFHNDFGVASGAALDSLPPDLADRLARGQVFNAGRDYLAGGMTLEVTPLLSVSPSLIVNLNDWSFDAAVEAKRSLSDNLDLIAGANLPIGPDGTEYGGLPITGGATTYATPAATAYAELRQLFLNGRPPSGQFGGDLVCLSVSETSTAGAAPQLMPACHIGKTGPHL